jgi:uncharacterized membrane protein YccC
MTIKEYITSEDTETAFRFIIGAALPLVVSTTLGYSQPGIFMLLGSLFVFSIDIPIALPKKLGFMVLTGFLSALIFVLFTQVRDFPILNAILLIVTLFALNFLAPFSPNFSTVALLLNLAVMIGLSMADMVPTLADALDKARFLLLGSGWYIMYALLLHPLQRPKQLRRRLQNCLRLTADYFAAQKALFDPAAEPSEVLLTLTQKQGAVVEVHQQIREVLLREPMNITNPETFMGQATHFLAGLVDLLELATASALSIQTVSNGAERDNVVPLLGKLNCYVVSQLHQLETQLEQEDLSALIDESDPVAATALQELDNYLNELRDSRAVETQNAEQYRQLRRIGRYTEQQLILLENMRTILVRRSGQLDLAADRLRQFAIHDTIGWDYLRSQFSFESAFFRYALRIALTAVGAFYLATWLGFGNPSWALLTVLVILKPGFNLSKVRLAHRVYGTIIGIVAGLTIFYVFKPGLIASMTIFLGSLFFAFSYIKRQYAVTTGFFTLFILFFYSYLQLEFMDAAYYRLLDTLLAGALCWLSIRFVFPYWEVQNLPKVVKVALQANRDLLDNVMKQLDTGKLSLTSYKLFRKEAFLKMDELLDSYRAAQAETPAHKELLVNIQRVLLLIYTQLSQIISLGLFLKRNADYRLQDPAIKNLLEEAQSGIESLIQSPKGEFGKLRPAEIVESMQQDLIFRRREIDELLLARSEEYLPKVHDLFLVESALELMEINDKLCKKLSVKSPVAEIGKL